MEDSMADRRVAPHYPFILLAEVTQLSSGTRLSARTPDISRTGCYIDTLKPMPKGSSIRIKLAYESEILELYGAVMYVSAGLGMGISFEEPCPRRNWQFSNAGWKSRRGNLPESLI